VFVEENGQTVEATNIKRNRCEDASFSKIFIKLAVDTMFHQPAPFLYRFFLADVYEK
jgi:hypothetical protein